MQSVVNKGCHDTGVDNTTSLLLRVCVCRAVLLMNNCKHIVSTKQQEYSQVTMCSDSPFGVKPFNLKSH